MMNTTRIGRLILAGTTAVLLSHTPVFAQTFAQTAYAAMFENITTGLEALQVPTKELGKLNAEQLSQLATILDSQDSSADKKAAAETVFRDALNPTVVSMGSDGAIQMEDQLKAQLTTVGLEYPAQGLTFAQVQKLLDIFQTPNANDATDAAAVLSEINNPTADTMRNPGAMQLKKQLMADLDRVGIMLPATVKLSFDQVIELTSVFDRKTNDEDKAAAAKAILGMI